MNSDATGFFGKLPAHGDFIHRNLPVHFINLWDEWLQAFVGATQEQLGEQWLDIYLTSPIWRFFLTSGVIDENQWAGVMLPSVDRVGRYFPFSVVTRIQQIANPLDYIAVQKHWYESIEEQCLAALDGQLLIDELIQEVNALTTQNSSPYNASMNQPTGQGVMVEMDFEEQSPAVVYPYLLDAFVVERFNSYSVWSTVGSERINPCTFISQALPSVSGAAAMLDGQWQQWNWYQPYQLKSL